MKTIYVVRHGESQENIDGIFTAGKSPLSEQGQKQAEALAKRFETIDLDIIFSSHFKRAEQTAEAVAKLKQTDNHVLDFVYEHSYLHDSFEGAPRREGEVKSIRDAIRASWLKDKPNDDEVNEGYYELLSRVDKFIDFINDRKEDSILLVTHTMFIYTLITRVIFKEKLTPSLVYTTRQNSQLSNSGITIFLVDDENKWKLKTLNDDLHT